MFCTNCGRRISDDASFCDACGYAVSDVDGSRVYHSSPRSTDPNTLQQPKEKIVLSVTILVLGILSFAFGWLPGLVLAIVCRFRIKKYMEKYGELEGLALAGSYLSVAGLVISLAVIAVTAAIVMFVVLYFGMSFVISLLVFFMELILNLFI